MNAMNLVMFMITFALFIKVSDSAYGCNSSLATISYVTSCPKSKTEWDIAASRKNCESLASLQQCTSAENFQYHCLENQWQNATMEICAPIFYLQGYCAKYNIDKRRVEENYEKGFECLQFPEGEKCPSRYPSTEAYKYQRCYKLKQQTPSQPTVVFSVSQSQSTPMYKEENLGNDDDGGTAKTVVIVILALALVIGIVAFILWYKRKALKLEQFCNRSRGTDEEVGSDANPEEVALIRDNDVQVEETKQTSNVVSEEMKATSQGSHRSDLAVSDCNSKLTDNSSETSESHGGLVKSISNDAKSKSDAVPASKDSITDSTENVHTTVPAFDTNTTDVPSKTAPVEVDAPSDTSSVEVVTASPTESTDPNFSNTNSKTALKASIKENNGNISTDLEFPKIKTSIMITKDNSSLPKTNFNDANPISIPRVDDNITSDSGMMPENFTDPKPSLASESGNSKSMTISDSKLTPGADSVSKLNATSDKNGDTKPSLTSNKDSVTEPQSTSDVNSTSIRKSLTRAHDSNIMQETPSSDYNSKESKSTPVDNNSTKDNLAIDDSMATKVELASDNNIIKSEKPTKDDNNATIEKSSSNNSNTIKKKLTLSEDTSSNEMSKLDGNDTATERSTLDNQSSLQAKPTLDDNSREKEEPKLDEAKALPSSFEENHNKAKSKEDDDKNPFNTESDDDTATNSNSSIEKKKPAPDRPPPPTQKKSVIPVKKPSQKRTPAPPPPSTPKSTNPFDGKED